MRSNYSVARYCEGESPVLREIAAERGLVGEVEAVGDSLHRGVRLVSEYLLGTNHHVVLDPIAGSVTGLLLYHLAEIFRC